jgi:hypothetical protein
VSQYCEDDDGLACHGRAHVRYTLGIQDDDGLRCHKFSNVRFFVLIKKI